MKWYQRKCEICNHSVEPISWDHHRVLTAHRLCGPCQRANLASYTQATYGSNIDVHDFIDLGLEDSERGLQLCFGYRWVWFGPWGMYMKS